MLLHFQALFLDRCKGRGKHPCSYGEPKVVAKKLFFPCVDPGSG